MPVDTAYGEVHDLTRDTGVKYGCHSKPRTAKGYWALGRTHFPDGSFDLTAVRVPSTTSKSCRSFYLWDTDQKCEGCTTPKDVAYAERMRGME